MVDVYQYHCDGVWNDFDEATCKQINESRALQRAALLLTQGRYREGTSMHRLYVIMLDLGLQRNRKTGTCRNIRRQSADLQYFDPIPDFTSTAEKMQNLLVSVPLSELPDTYTECNICLAPFTGESGMGSEVSSELQIPPLGAVNQDDLPELGSAMKLPRCSGHYFHKECIMEWLSVKQQCPYCKEIYGQLTGNCPPGTMTITHLSEKLPGWTAQSILHINTKVSSGTWMMTWTMNHGYQCSEHPKPGKFYSGTSRSGFMPDTPDFRKVLRMLKIAWQRRLMFTIGFSLTRGVHDVITWNGIHIRTEWEDSWGFGWRKTISLTGTTADEYIACEDWLYNVTDELKTRGITEHDQVL